MTRLAFLVPPGVTVHFTRMVAHGEAGSHRGQDERNRTQIAHLDENVALIAMVKPAVIVMAHAATSYTLGKEGEAGLVERLRRSSGIPFITAFGSVLEALATPYSPEATLKSKAYLEEHGLAVPAWGQLENVKNIYEETAERAYALVRRVDSPEAQAVFISRVGKPVISSASAMMWNALRTAGVRTPVNGYGSLLSQGPIRAGARSR